MMHVYFKILFAVGVLLFAVVSRAGVRCEDVWRSEPKTVPAVELRTFEASETLSQKIRDNAPHYWDFALQRGRNYFGDLAKFKGLVVGDTHPGNFIVSRLAGRMQFFIADIKDSGQAPYIYDISRLVLSTHSYLKGSVKLPETADVIMKAYQQGLNGQEYKIPKSIRWIFEESLQAYAKSELEYVYNKVKNDKFKLKEGALEDISFRTTDPAKFSRLKNDIEKAVHESIPHAHVLDLAFRPRERGGSAEMIRYWALIRVEGQLKILEFKEVSVPATSQYEPQQQTLARYDRIFKTFWQVSDPLYKLSSLDGTIYMMRPKKSDVFRVKYRNQSKKDIEFGLQLAAYDAYYLGGLHARQQKSTQYADLVTQNHQKIVENLRHYVKDYIEDLKRALDNMPGEKQ